jgi:hypothetical protein
MTIQVSVVKPHTQAEAKVTQVDELVAPFWVCQITKDSMNVSMF